MEKRAHKRIPVSIEAELTSEGIQCVAYIRNVSEGGINTIITPVLESGDFTPATELNLKFRLPYGEAVNLKCRKKWSHEISPHKPTVNVGVEIINPPIEYMEFLHSLQ
jgi:hypothetical protein